MAVNKNFVVKNGLEVNENLILANADDKRVGIASTTPNYTLDVSGGIGATDLVVSGFTTLTQDLQVGTSGSIFYVSDSNSNVGVGTSAPDAAYTLEVRSSVSTGQTALYVYGDMRVTGDINLDDIILDDVRATDLYVSGLSTFVGVSTFESTVYTNGDVNLAGSAGVTSIRWDQSQQSLEFLDETKASFGTNNDLQISHTNSLKDQDDSEGVSVVDGWTSYINEQGTGGLVFKSNGNSGEGAYQFFDTSWRPIVRLFSGVNARSVLYYGGLDRFETTGVGATVHGSLGILTDLTVGGNLNVTGDIVYDEVTGRNINISGLSTFEGLSYFGSNVGVGTTNPAIAADSNNTNILNAGIVTANYIYGDISGATGVTTAITAAIGVSSEGTFVGTGATIINFVSSNGTSWDIQNSGAGIATATITPGVSIGLAIALGG